MKLITLLVSTLLFIGCQSNEQPFTSNYARIYDERINRDLATLLMTDSSQNKDLFQFIDKTIEKLIIGSGGFNKNGILINGQRTGIAAIVLKEQNFFKQLSELLEEQKVDSARYEYLRTGFLIVTQWPEYGISNITVTDAYFGLTLIQNRVLTSSLISK